MRTRRLLGCFVLTAAVLTVIAPTALGRIPASVVADIPTGGHVARSPVARAAALGYLGGPVLHLNRTHLILWQPSGSGLTFDPGYQSLIETFFRQVAADSHKPTNVYALTGQYHDSRGAAVYNSSYGGAVLDSDPLPRNGCNEPPLTGPGWKVCLTSDQIDAEVTHVATVDRLPRAIRDVYVLVTPRGFGSCEGSGPSDCALGGSAGGYCGYHTVSADGTIKYAVIPYNAVSGHCQSDAPRPNSSTADPTISTISHEHNEMITDPLGSGWIDPAGNENGDLCIGNFGPTLGGGANGFNQVIDGGHYYLQEEWSNQDGGCVPRDESGRASLSVSRRPRAHKETHFIGHGDDADGSIVAYIWSFGDGKGGRGRKPKHRYKRAGTYRVVLRTADVAGLWAFSARTIRVR